MALEKFSFVEHNLFWILFWPSVRPSIRLSVRRSNVYVPLFPVLMKVQKEDDGRFTHSHATSLSTISYLFTTIYVTVCYRVFVSTARARSRYIAVVHVKFVKVKFVKVTTECLRSQSKPRKMKRQRTIAIRSKQIRHTYE